jgi:hypothetical protein
LQGPLAALNFAVPMGRMRVAAASLGSRISNWRWARSGWRRSKKFRRVCAGSRYCRIQTTRHGLGSCAQSKQRHRRLAWRSSPPGIHEAGDIVDTIEAFAREADGGLIVLPSPPATMHRNLIVTLAARHRLRRSTLSATTDGGLISYGPNTVDLFAS